MNEGLMLFDGYWKSLPRNFFNDLPIGQQDHLKNMCEASFLAGRISTRPKESIIAKREELIKLKGFIYGLYHDDQKKPKDIQRVLNKITHRLKQLREQ